LGTLETIIVANIGKLTVCGRSMVRLGRVDAGTTPAATNSQWVFQTSVDVTLLLLLLAMHDVIFGLTHLVGCGSRDLRETSWKEREHGTLVAPPRVGTAAP
jgi:hypothetical protein